MRVLFIQTLSVEGVSQERVYPLGIVTLAGLLQDRGYEVGLLDMNLEPDPFGAVKQRLLGFKPDVVGLSLRNIDPLANKTSSLVPPFLVTARLVASVMPKAWIIAGGRRVFPFSLEVDARGAGNSLRNRRRGGNFLAAPLASLENPPLIQRALQARGRRNIDRLVLPMPGHGSLRAAGQEPAGPLPLFRHQFLRSCRGDRNKARLSFSLRLLRISQIAGEQAAVPSAAGCGG